MEKNELRKEFERQATSGANYIAWLESRLRLPVKEKDWGDWELYDELEITDTIHGHAFFVGDIVVIRKIDLEGDSTSVCPYFVTIKGQTVNGWWISKKEACKISK